MRTMKSRSSEFIKISCSQIRQGEVGHWSGISRPFTGAGRGQTGRFHSARDLVAISVGGTLSNIILHPLSTAFEISVSSCQLFSILLQFGTLQLAICMHIFETCK